MLNKNPDRRPGISQVIQTKLITKYTKALIGYGRAIKFQLDELKKVLEEIGEDEAEHDTTYVKEESKAKQSDANVKVEKSYSINVIAKDEKKANMEGEVRK